MERENVFLKLLLVSGIRACGLQKLVEHLLSAGQILPPGTLQKRTRKLFGPTVAPSFLGKALSRLSTVTGQREKQDGGRRDPGPLFIKNTFPHFLEDESRKLRQRQERLRQSQPSP